MLASVALVVFGHGAFAQTGAFSQYSPYSVFGIGDLYSQGTAYSKTMGGVGIAGRDVRYINYLNPAAVTVRDTLSVLFDVSFYSGNNRYGQGGFTSANNTLNVNNISFSFPIWRSLAFSAGLSPFSSVGYDYSYSVDDKELIAEAGGVTYTSGGMGSLYQGFAGLGFDIGKRLSVGGQLLYYFGNIDKETKVEFGSSSQRSIYSGHTLQLNALGGKFGVQYEQPLGNKYLTLGATYRTSSKLKGYITEYKEAQISSLVDTLVNVVDTLSRGNVKIASEIGFGVSFRKPDKWSVEIDYTMSDWGGTNMFSTAGLSNVAENVTFTTSKYQSVRAGFEFIPNRNDIRYYLRTCSYRVGAYWKREYYRVNGNTVDAYGLTLGMTLPVFRWYNGISVGVDLGQRGSLKGDMTRERYVNFVVGFNIHDLWFVKPRYE